MAKRVEVKERSIFGEFNEDALQNPGKDIFFLPGYSDKRREWELAWRDFQLGKGKKPRPLSHRFQFVSFKERLTGADRVDKVPQFTADGYQPVHGYKEYERLTGVKLTDETGRPLYNVREDAQGNLVVGTQMLMYCDADVAARNLGAARQRTERMEESVKARAEQAAVNFNAALRLSKDGATDYEIGVVEDEGE